MSKKTISTDKSAKRDPNVALEIKDQNSTKGKINPMSKRCRKNLIVIIWIARKMVHYKITTSAIFLIWALVLIWKSWIAFLLGCCTCWSCSLIFIFVNWSRKCTWISFFDVYICTHLVLWLWHAKNLGLNRIITFFVFFFIWSLEIFLVALYAHGIFMQVYSFCLCHFSPSPWCLRFFEWSF